MIIQEQAAKPKHFQFRDLHPKVFLGTASDRYAGWIGQIYSQRLYEGHISRRSKRVGGKAFSEDVLPIESVAEYFRHFPVLELDFTFYGTLLDSEGKPTRNWHALKAYSRYLNKTDRLILKVPQTIFARKLLKGGTYLENKQFLNARVFVDQFYRPALGLVAPWLTGLIFEQEYQRKTERPSPQKLADGLDAFFGSVPVDHRYHVELRTDTLLTYPVFDILEKYGVGQVFSHWTWLPTLTRQFSLSGQRFLNQEGGSIIRLMTPRGMRYEDAYALAHPFNSIVDGMTSPMMIKETVEIMRVAVREDTQIHVIVNNRAGGNAPLIAQQIARRFMGGASGL